MEEILKYSLSNISSGMMLATALIWAIVFLFGRTVILREEYRRSESCELRKWTGIIALWMAIAIIVGIYVRHNFSIDNPRAKFTFLYMDMMAVPIGALICVLLTHSKHITMTRILANIIPFLMIWITGMIITTDWYLYIIIALVVGYSIAMMIYVIHGAKQREHWLKDTYADTYGRTLNWTWVVPVLLVFLIVCWMLYIVSPHGLSFSIYYLTSFVIWNFIFVCIYQMVVIQEGEDSKMKSETESIETEETENQSEDESKEIKKLAMIAENTSDQENSIPLSEEEQAMHTFKMKLLSIIESKDLYASELLTRDYLARKMAISHSTFSKILKQATGMTFYDYINSIRVQKAARLLRNSELGLQEIGEKVGYKYRSTFYRAFNNAFNCTPAEYRQKYIDGTLYPQQQDTNTTK